MLLQDGKQELENKMRVLEQQELDNKKRVEELQKQLQQCEKVEKKKLKECKCQLKQSRLTCGNEGCGKEETKPRTFKECSKCELNVYCGKECQRADWARHRENCVDKRHWTQHGT